MSQPDPNDFSGYIRAILAKQPGEKPHQEDIDDDIEGEKETIPGLMEDDSQQSDEEDETPGHFAATWRASITSASKGVTEKTDSEYQRSVIWFLSIFFIDSTLQALRNNVPPF